MTLQRDNTLRDATDVVESEGAALFSDEIELAQLIVTTLNLDINPADIDPVAPLYGEGLGLDSIGDETLELPLLFHGCPFPGRLPRAGRASFA